MAYRPDTLTLAPVLGGKRLRAEIDPVSSKGSDQRPAPSPT
ncbi:MAG: hypothetical protein ACLTZY_09525 [Alistipes indistinctus]